MNEHNDMTYGMHLTLRVAEVSNREAIDGPAIGDLLIALVKRIGMRVLAGPLTAEEAGTADKRGWSSLVLLYESHAAIHTYPELGQAFLDVFSCKPFNADQVKDILSEYVGDFRVVEQNMFDRGVHWGTSIERELAAFAGSR